MTVATFTTQTATIAYQPRGMFYSEIYLLMQVCESEGVTTIIESGVCNGMSTRLLHAAWGGQVVSIEHHARNLPTGFPFPVQIGDGANVIPTWLFAHPQAVVGVLLDGPKSHEADALRVTLSRHKQVRVIAQHDSGPGKGEAAHSWDETFRADVGTALDARIDPQIRALYPHGAPGMGVWRVEKNRC